MGEKRVLRVHGEDNANYVDIDVDDIDTCMLMDIFVDLIEGAEMKGMNLPEYPCLFYNYNWKFVKLVTDMDLVKMFNDLNNKILIDIYIGFDETPSNTL